MTSDSSHQQPALSVVYRSVDVLNTSVGWLL